MPPEELEFWIDLNLPPIMSVWLRDEFKVKAESFINLGFEFYADVDVFREAQKRKEVIIITTKDIDFIPLQKEMGTPPKIFYINTGNISNKELHRLISNNFKEVLKILTKTNQSIVELTNKL